MNTEIYLVRHAHSVFDIENEEFRGLSDKGRKDAEKVKEILSSESIDHIVSSSYVRAIQTVESLSKLINKEIEKDYRFREGCLAAADYIFEDPVEAFKYSMENPDFSYPGGESCNEVKERGLAALNELLHKYKGKKIVIGIHGNIMTNIMHHFDRTYDFNFWKSTTKPDIYKLSISESNQLLNTVRLWEES
ncbi:histidine phosphatase family protein [Solibacillus sp. FSL W8-0372]|uniref:histidine phosphatase family protein n=1 Tax=Solibacillus sp. FSL W8-0372 TaxID=2921713 RepID=UPI0030D10036